MRGANSLSLSHPNPDPTSYLGLGLGPDPAFVAVPAPLPGAVNMPKPESLVDFSVTDFRNSDILLEFDSDSSSDRRGQDILFHFDSDSGDEVVDDPESMEDGELDRSNAVAGMSRKPGGVYTEFDFDFLDKEWLELSDDASSDEISNNSSSTD